MRKILKVWFYCDAINLNFWLSKNATSDFLQRMETTMWKPATKEKQHMDHKFLSLKRKYVDLVDSFDRTIGQRNMVQLDGGDDFELKLKSTKKM